MSLENQDTINKTGELKKKTNTLRKKKNRKVKIYLSFMTLVLLTLVIQISYSALLNISKIVNYRGKIVQSLELKRQAEVTNAHLKNELKNFNSMNKVESIARNNLKMAGENEVLVIINTPKPEIKPKTKKEKFIDFFEKNIVRKILQTETQTNPNFVLP